MRINFPDFEKLAPGKILVVDEEEETRRTLRQNLEQYGYKVIESVDSKGALSQFKPEKPEALLLDLFTEEINGYQVCRTVKGNPETELTPILLISDFNQQEERLRGLEAGADGFISKPIDFKEVRIRVRSNLYKKRLYDRIRDAYARLEEIEQLRENLNQMIIHDLRSHLTALAIWLELLSRDSEGKISDAGFEILQTARKLTDIILHMAQSLLDLTLLENNNLPLNMEENELVSIIREVLTMLQPKLQSHQIDFNPFQENISAWCDIEATRRIFINLLDNAVRFAPSGSTIHLAISPRKKDLLIEVVDHGSGIVKSEQDKLFNKFVSLDNSGKKGQGSTGLGLVYCKLATEAQGGEIGVESEIDQGSNFWFTLPRLNNS